MTIFVSAHGALYGDPNSDSRGCTATLLADGLRFELVARLDQAERLSKFRDGDSIVVVGELKLDIGTGCLSVTVEQVVRATPRGSRRAGDR